MRRKRFSALMCAAAVAVSVSPMINVSAEGSVNVKMSADEQEQSVTLVSKEDTNAVLICADRDGNGVLEGMTITDVKLTADTEMVVTKDMGLGAFDDGDKLMLVKDLESLQPLSETVEIGNDAPDETQTATAEPTETASVKSTETITQSPTGEPVSVEFSAGLVADTESHPVNSVISDHCMAVYESEESRKVLEYDLSDDITMFVNCVELEYLDDNDVWDYICDNPRGTVKLTDNEGDGIYDKIDVDYSRAAVVDSVVPQSDGTVIVYFMTYDQSMETKLNLGTDVLVSLTDENGEHVELDEIQRYDVFSIEWDVNEMFANSSFYKIKLSRNSVTGKLTAINRDKGILSIDGTEYECLDLLNIDRFSLEYIYTIYIDAYGDIAYAEEIDNSTDYGVVVGMYMKPGDEYPTVRLITADGSILEAEARNAEEADKFFTVVMMNGDISPEDGYVENYDGEAYTISYTADDLQNNVCSYRLTTNGLMYLDTYHSSGGEKMEYRESSGRIGSYKISGSVTRIVDAEAYISGASKTVYAADMSDFENEELYTAYTYDRDDSGYYRFVLITDGIEREPAPVNESVGVVTGIYTEEGDELPKVRIMSSDGAVIEENVGTLEDAEKFFMLLNETGSVTPESAETLLAYKGECITSYSDPEKIIDDMQNNVCRYSISDNGIGYVETMAPSGGKDLVFNASSSSLGPVAISENTNIISLERYMNGVSKKPDTMSLEEFSDGESYTAYIYDEGDFVLVLEGADGADESEEILSKGIGVVVGMYMTAGGEEPAVRIITSDGTMIEEETDNAEETNRFFTLVSQAGEIHPEDMSLGELGKYNNESYSKADKELIVDDMQNNVCEFELTENGLKCADVLVSAGGEGLVYDSDSVTLGTYGLTDDTSIVDIVQYINGLENGALSLPVSALVDGAEYAAYFYDNNGDGIYDLVLIFSGTVGLRPESDIGVVSESGTLVYINGMEYISTEVLCSGSERTIYIDRSAEELCEGDIIAYSSGNNGIVEEDDLIVLMYAEEDYNDLRELPFIINNFSDMLVSDDRVYDPETNDVLYGSSDKDVKQYFGVVYYSYDGEISLITSAENGISDTDTALKFNKNNDTNIYIYDYELRAGNRLYVTSELPMFHEKYYDGMYEGTDSNWINWTLESDYGIEPIFAYVKTVDGNMTDVVMFMSPCS